MYAKRNRRYTAVWAVGLLATLAAPALGVGLPLPDPRLSAGQEIALDGFVDHAGRRFSSTGDDPRPWIVCPIYTRCPTTCSALTSALMTSLERSALRPSEYRVLVLSFDPQETDASLAEFRGRMQLPADWLTVRAGDRRALERALRGLDFRTIELDDGRFEHPNLVAVLDAGRRVTGYVYGLDLSPTELARAVRQARDGTSALDPLRWYPLAGAAVGLLISAIIFFTALGHARGSTRAGSAPRSIAPSP